MEKIIRNAFAIIIVLLVSAVPALADSKCGKNAYVDEITTSDTERTIVCACAPGFERRDNQCKRTIPESLIDYLSFMTMKASTGEVAIYAEHDNMKIPVSGQKMFYANVVIVGATGYLTAFLDNEMRLRVSAETELRLGELVPESMLSIDSLKGMIRLDNHLSPEDKEWIKKQMTKAKAYFKRYRKRRLTIRGNVAMAVRGTDFTLEGKEDGTIIMHLIDGKIDMEELISGEKMSLGKGDKVLIPADGGIPYKAQ